MSLSPRVRFGPYEITCAIGAGGMGEVFRPRDTRLGRHVAIKVLPEAFARARQSRRILGLLIALSKTTQHHE